MFWIYYYILPAIAAWKWRKQELIPSIYYLYGTMLSAFLSVWGAAQIRSAMEQNLAHQPLLSARWVTPLAMVLIWPVVFAVWTAALQRIAPKGINDFTPPQKVSKILTPIVIFLHGGIVCALVFTILSAVPLENYTSPVTKNPALCSGARYRLLWTSFFIDRASFQPVSWTARRNSFGRFVPREPQKPGK